MADVKQKYKTPNGDNIIDKDFADFKESGGSIGGEVTVGSLTSQGSATVGSLVSKGTVKGTEFTSDSNTILSGTGGTLNIRPIKGSDEKALSVGGTNAVLSPMSDTGLGLGEDSKRWRELHVKSIFMNGALYIKDFLTGALPNDSDYSRIVRSSADAEKGSFKVQIGKSGGTFEVVNSNWDKSLFSVANNGEIHFGADYYRNGDNGYLKLNANVVLSYGSVVLKLQSTDPFGYPVYYHRQPLNLPIAYNSIDSVAITPIDVGHPDKGHMLMVAANASDIGKTSIVVNATMAKYGSASNSMTVRISYQVLGTI